MKKYSLFLLFILTCITLTYGQGSVEIVKDPRIDELIKKQGEVIPPATAVQMNGYRVQLFFDSEKAKVDQARVQFAKSFPKIETYVTYSAPNYFLKVGDFRNSLDADRLKSEVGSTYPTSFIVQEKINLPRID